MYLDANWNTKYKAPMIIRSFKLLSHLNICKLPMVNAPLVSPLSFTVESEAIFIHEFPIANLKLTPNSQIINAFNHIRLENYQGYTEIYCDGSLIKNPPSTTAAMILMHCNNTMIEQSWKLKPHCSIFTAELFAISQSLKYAINNINNVTGLVIFSDSQSSILSLQQRKPKRYVPLILEVQGLVQQLQNRFPVILQYIPGHKGIKGNTKADELAKLAHTRHVSLLSPLPKEDMLPHVKTAVWKYWKDLWLRSVESTGKGKALLSIKSNLNTWQWTSLRPRILETAMAKLRIGHAGVNSYLYKINKSQTDKCVCGQKETIDHFLLQCPLYSIARTELKESLDKIRVPHTKKNLLGGGEYDVDIQNKIIELCCRFLTSTGRLKLI